MAIDQSCQYQIKLFFRLIPPPRRSTLFPYTTLFRSYFVNKGLEHPVVVTDLGFAKRARAFAEALGAPLAIIEKRSEEHTSELQSRRELVCRLLLEKKNSRKARV